MGREVRRWALADVGKGVGVRNWINRGRRQPGLSVPSLDEGPRRFFSGKLFGWGDKMSVHLFGFHVHSWGSRCIEGCLQQERKQSRSIIRGNRGKCGDRGWQLMAEILQWKSWNVDNGKHERKEEETAAPLRKSKIWLIGVLERKKKKIWERKLKENATEYAFKIKGHEFPQRRCIKCNV